MLYFDSKMFNFVLLCICCQHKLSYQENIYRDHRDFTIIHTPSLMYGQYYDKQSLNKYAVGG